MKFEYVFWIQFYWHNVLGKPRRIRVNLSGAQAIRLTISLWEDNYTREKWEDVQWGQNELRMRARRVAKRLSRDSSETSVKPRRKPLKPRSRWSGIRAQHESESELPPGANDYETTALSASPIVRDICHIFSIGSLCEPNISRTHAKRTFVLRWQSRLNTLTQTKTKYSTDLREPKI